VAEQASLERSLTTWDTTLLTIGSIVGTGIFLTTSDIARQLPHAGWIVLVWIAGGLLSLAGALTYAEIGAMFPRAGGIYHYLKEAYGPLWGFLYGWAGFLVIMSGGNAAIAVGFGTYLGGFVPWFSVDHVLWSIPVGSWTWSVNGAQAAAVAAILVLTFINARGLKAGAGAQNLLTLLKAGAIGFLVLAGFWVAAPVDAVWTGPLPASAPAGSLWVLFGIAMVGALWTYDGWYGATFSAGEMRDPGRNLPRGIVYGTIAVTVLYVAINVVYARAMTPEQMAGSARIGEDAAAALAGPQASKWVAGAILISTLGCLASTILYSSRLYAPMAEDGLFFKGLAKIDPETRVPVRSLWAQTAWTVALTVSGTYSQLYTYVVFAALLFHVATAASVFVLRRKFAHVERPYRVFAYPWTPLLFIGASLLLVGNTLVTSPKESLWGLALVAAGLPAYASWRRRGPAAS
jgi:APA family basic amino acid/polyamine antiporter